MKIKKLILHKNKRLHLLNGDTFTLIITGQHVVIRGVNGGGKSTILNEASPLPSNMRDYADGGYKKIFVEHDGCEFELTSSGKNAGKHSFLMDGVELNTGGTQSVQFQLVEAHFQYTKAVHEVMLGVKCFTAMSGNERREWFNKLSKTDSEFVTKLWDVIRSGQRDNSGALKNIKQKITEHTANLADDEELKECTDSLEHYKGRLKEVQLLRQKYIDGQIDNQRKEDLLVVINKTIAQMHAEYDKLLENISLANGSELNGIKDIDAELSGEGIERNRLYKLSAEVTDKLNDINDTIHRLAFEDDTPLVDLENNVLKLRDEMRDAVSENTISDYSLMTKWISKQRLVSLAERLANPSFTEMDGLSEIVTTLLNGSKTPKEASASLRKNNTRLEEVNRTIGIINVGIKDLEEHLSHLKEEPEHECPNCNHRFKNKGVDERLAFLNDKRKRAMIKLNELTTEKNELEEMIAVDNDIMNVTRSMMRIVLNEDSPLYQWLELREFRDMRAREDRIEFVLENPGLFLTLKERVLSSTRGLLDYISRLEKIEAAEILLEKGKVKASPEYLELTARHKLLTEEQTKLNADIQKSTDRLNTLSKHKETIDLIHRTHSSICHYYDTYFDALQSVGKLDFKSTVDNIILIISNKIDEIDKVIQHHSGIRYLVNSLKENRKSVEESIHIHQGMMDLLNPRNGLIAKSMVGFIRFYINEMNQLIKQIWSYRLEIRLDEHGNFTKDYKFPVLIGDTQSGLSKDVSETSTGQSEVIDLTFKLVMAKHLKLDQWCIYADELGGSLNPIHRNRLFGLLKRMIEEHRHSQLFMITHLNDIEGMMTQAQIVDLK